MLSNLNINDSFFTSSIQGSKRIYSNKKNYSNDRRNKSGNKSEYEIIYLNSINKTVNSWSKNIDDDI